MIIHYDVILKGPKNKVISKEEPVFQTAFSNTFYTYTTQSHCATVVTPRNMCRDKTPPQKNKGNATSTADMGQYAIKNKIQNRSFWFSL